MKKLQLIHIFFLFIFFNAIKDIYANNCNEKIYLFLDRSIYTSGETIWYQVNCNQSNCNENNAESKLSYVEFINGDGKVIDRKRILLNNQSGSGSFIIPDTVSSGYYNIIAYTLKGVNYSIDNVSKSSVLIFNPEKDNKYSNKKIPREFIWSSENNKIVAGLDNKIYYHTNYFTERIDIIDNFGDTSSSTYNNSFGVLDFKPQLNRKYRITSLSSDTTISVDLNEVEEQDFLFNLIEVTNDKFLFLIQSDSVNNIEINAEIFSDTLRKKTFNILINKEKVWWELNKNDVSPGRNLILIKDRQGKNLWTRFIYNIPENYDISLIDLKNKYDRRSKVSFNLSNNCNRNSLSEINACISVKKIPKDSVFKSDSNLYEDNVNNINRWAAFDNTKNDTIYKNKYDIKYFDINNRVTLNGRIIDFNGAPLSNINITMNTVDSVSRINYAKSDSNGEFTFFIYPDRPKIDLTIIPETKEKNTIIIKDNYLNDYSFLQNIRNENTIPFNDYLKELYINHRVQKIYNQNYSGIEETLKNPSWSDENFFGTPDYILDLDKYIELDSIHEYFHELVPFVRVINANNGKKDFRIVDKKTGQLIFGNPTFIIDGVLYNDSQIFMSLNPRSCKKISVIRSRFFIYNKIYGGILIINTKEGDLKNIQLPQNSSRIEFIPYNISKEFKFEPTPDYIPDFRNTLYWLPNISIDSAENKNIEFYTGDDLGYYEIKIEGLSKDGRLIREKWFFEVVE